jgi:uncharacterized RmlC-like cupin family protein
MMMYAHTDVHTHTHARMRAQVYNITGSDRTRYAYIFQRTATRKGLENTVIRL